MARSASRRFGRSPAQAALTVLALAAGLGLAATAPAAADTNTYGDSIGEPDVPPAYDITSYRATLTATSLTVTIWTRATAADPLAADPHAWIGIETNRGHSESYQLTNDSGTWQVTGNDHPTTPTCPADHTVGVNTITVTVPASCIGSPAEAAFFVELLVPVPEGSWPFADWAPAPELRPTRQFYPAPMDAGPDIAPTTNPQVAVYRFYSPDLANAHFFTTDEAEASGLMESRGSWHFEGPAFNAIAKAGSTCPEGRPVHRFWSPVVQSHFYTQNEAEKDSLIAHDRRWSYEGVAYCAYAEKTLASIPLYRFWSPRFGKHFYTADPMESEHLRTVDHDWNYEGIAYYVLP
ncbi:hypothetical protein [Cellulomonas sp. URHB0016]